MDYKVFTKILRLQKKGSAALAKAHKAKVDLYDFTEPYDAAISLLLSAYYGKDGADWISWFVWEKDGNDEMKAYDADDNEICRTTKELWEMVEHGRFTMEEYKLPKKLSKKARQSLLTAMAQELSK